jgi:BirA family biotin operon repressor/biotin-[acetyl-CoA-carboxylase] ligase
LKSLRSDSSIPVEFVEAFARARERFGRLGSDIFHFASIGSTNDVAASLAANPAAEGVVVIADAQTAGRGRRGRSWFSPPGAGLYVSVILTPGRARPDPARAEILLTLMAGVALAEGIGVATGLAPDIKWPNDLLIGRRKVAGILAEGLVESVILGYGINVGPMSYPRDLADRATSLEAELGRPVDRAVVCAETLAALNARYDDLLAGRFDAILDAWRQRAPSHRGARVSWETASGLQTGVTAGIDERGALLVRVGEQIEHIVAGEVQWL